jgi:nucleotide-binding universal stress UspA family protein
MRENAMPEPPAIVVGVDGTPASEAALVFALREGSRRGGAVEVVTAWVFPRPYEEVARPESIEQQRAHAEHTQDETVTSALHRVDGAPVVSRSVVQGAAGPVLLQASRDADYLVVGSAHKGAPARFLLGSVSQYCVRHAAIPVMVVPLPARLAKHRTKLEETDNLGSISL